LVLGLGFSYNLAIFIHHFLEPPKNMAPQNAQGDSTLAPGSGNVALMVFVPLHECKLYKIPWMNIKGPIVGFHQHFLLLQKQFQVERWMGELFLNEDL